MVKWLVKCGWKTRGVTGRYVAIPFPIADTHRGEVAQVDFGYVGYLFDPHEKRLCLAYVLVMVLWRRRRMATRPVFDQKVATRLRPHIEAITELGDLPRITVPDNLRSAVIRAGGRRRRRDGAQ